MVKHYCIHDKRRYKLADMQQKQHCGLPSCKFKRAHAMETWWQEIYESGEQADPVECFDASPQGSSSKDGTDVGVKRKHTQNGQCL